MGSPRRGEGSHTLLRRPRSRPLPVPNLTARGGEKGKCWQVLRGSRGSLLPDSHPPALSGVLLTSFQELGTRKTPGVGARDVRGRGCRSTPGCREVGCPSQTAQSPVYPSAPSPRGSEQSHPARVGALQAAPRAGAPASTHPVPDLGREPVGRALVELRGAHGGTDGPGAGRADLGTGCGRTVRDRAERRPRRPLAGGANVLIRRGSAEFLWPPLPEPPSAAGDPPSRQSHPASPPGGRGPRRSLWSYGKLRQRGVVWASYLLPTPYHSERTPNPKVWSGSPSLPLQTPTSLYPPRLSLSEGMYSGIRAG